MTTGSALCHGGAIQAYISKRLSLHLSELHGVKTADMSMGFCAGAFTVELFSGRGGTFDDPYPTWRV